MQHPDEGMIHTWLDGELPAEEAAALEAHVAECEQCRASVAEARGFIAASSRIVGTLDNVPGGVIPVAKPVKRVWYSSPQFRAAAAVLIVAGASFLIMRPVAKSTVAISSKSEANRGATVQSPLAAATPAEIATAPVQSPVVADQMPKKETAKPMEQSTPKGFAVLSAPVRKREPASTSMLVPKTNEADFSGKGVKGGTAFGVAGGVPLQDTSAIASQPAMKAAEALSPRSTLLASPRELKVIHVDSSLFMKRTIYQSSSGKEVVFTEQPEQSMLSEVVVTGVATESRKTATRSAPTTANAPVAQAPPASTSPAPAPSAQNEIAVHTISWVDSTTRRRYSLTGPVSVEELEAIKDRILQAKK